ncbi:MAG: alpha/beta fold hydrolase [Pseudomonadales bacterium]
MIDAERKHHHTTINGIGVHFVEQGQGQPVILCHGFPHTWYSWSRQMDALSAAGYRVIAPDMRGMGQTEAPANASSYGVDSITADLIGLLDHLCLREAVFGGLDFGAFAVYDLALLHPERVTAVIGLENPAAPHNPDVPPLTEYAELAKNNFLHIEYFRPVGPADKDLDAEPRAFLQKVFYALSGAYDFGEVMAKPAGITYLEALPEAPQLPWNWLSVEDFEEYVKAYSESGFTGGLNWYRSMDLKWQHRKALEGVHSPVPAFFIGSEYDVDLEHFHGDDPISLMRAQFPNLLRVEMIANAGHLVQLENSPAVNAKLLQFLKEIY